MPSKKVIIIALAIVAAPVLAVAWWLLSPLFMNTTVDEEFPASVPAAAVVPLPDDVTMPPDMTLDEARGVMVGMAKLDAPMTEPMPSEMMASADAATAVSAGEFQDADSFHRGSGSATIYRLPSGEGVLRLENFSVTNGPRLHVILTPSANPEGRSDVRADGHLDLGGLKGNRGDQNYPIPADADLSSFGSAVIYCVPFNVVFSVATLEAR